MKYCVCATLPYAFIWNEQHHFKWSAWNHDGKNGSDWGKYKRRTKHLKQKQELIWEKPTAKQIMTNMVFYLILMKNSFVPTKTRATENCRKKTSLWPFYRHFFRFFSPHTSRFIHYVCCVCGHCANNYSAFVLILMTFHVLEKRSKVFCKHYCYFFSFIRACQRTERSGAVVWSWKLKRITLLIFILFHWNFLAFSVLYLNESPAYNTWWNNELLFFTWIFPHIWAFKWMPFSTNFWHAVFFAKKIDKKRRRLKCYIISVGKVAVALIFGRSLNLLLHNVCNRLARMQFAVFAIKFQSHIICMWCADVCERNLLFFGTLFVLEMVLPKCVS